MQPRLAGPAANTLSRFLLGALGIAALIAAFFFGLVVLALAVGLGLIAWLLLALRLWWLRRRMPPGGPAGGDGEVIEAEYRVVSRRQDD